MSIISFFFFKQKTAYEIMPSLVGSEMCIRDRLRIGENAFDNDDFLYVEVLRRMAVSSLYSYEQLNDWAAWLRVQVDSAIEKLVQKQCQEKWLIGQLYMIHCLVCVELKEDEDALRKCVKEVKPYVSLNDFGKMDENQRIITLELRSLIISRANVETQMIMEEELDKQSQFHCLSLIHI
eukprot:TRINITY_DN13924_c0_g1_i3.p1 TRINITY_DN13924_c0_g1~~TRINITY_DN13924_c0_g1_i3.p1  ORF type:complete len:179 (-),score=26.80 TRINITY_DN13924_c0_g1_i3:63-599(-)